MPRALRHELASRAAALELATAARDHHAILVPGAIAEATPGEPVELALELGGVSHTLTATALQLLPGHGLVAGVDSAAAAALDAWIAGLPDQELEPPTDEPPAEDEAAGPKFTRRPMFAGDKMQSEDDVGARYRKMSPTEKIQAALHGSREMRGMVMRDTNRTLHVYLLKNGHLGIDEVATMARIQSLSTEALIQIARHDSWGLDPNIATSLVRNPKLPVPIAIEVLEKVPRAELRRLATGNGVRMPIAQAAARRIAKLR
jgi:hypothetical protein